MVKRYGFDDDGITWGPNTDGAFVSAHEYDALAARLAEAERLLTDTWLLPDGRNPNLEREVWDFFNPPAKAGEDVGRGTLSTRTDDSADAVQARLAEAERLLRATVDGYPIGATNDGGVFVNGGLTGEILVYFALYDEPLRASDSASGGLK